MPNEACLVPPLDHSDSKADLDRIVKVAGGLPDGPVRCGVLYGRVGIYADAPLVDRREELRNSLETIAYLHHELQHLNGLMPASHRQFSEFHKKIEAFGRVLADSADSIISTVSPDGKHRFRIAHLDASSPPDRTGRRSCANSDVP